MPLLLTADSFLEVGITLRQVDHWTGKGYLVPEGSPRPGSGHSRRWEFAELVVAQRIKFLLDAGLKLEVAADIARRGAGVHDLSDHVVVVLKT
jgi:DNA-binding transcriptional MerR regulator